MEDSTSLTPDYEVCLGLRYTGFRSAILADERTLTSQYSIL